MRLATEESAAGLIAEAQAAAEVKDADEGQEFGRGKRLRYAGTNAGQTLQGRVAGSKVCLWSLQCPSRLVQKHSHLKRQCNMGSHLFPHPNAGMHVLLPVH